VVALRQHLQQRDLAQRGGGHALLLHLHSTAVGETGQLKRPPSARLHFKPTPAAARPRPHAGAHLQPRLLQGHQVARVLVAGLVHLAIRALSHLLQLPIVLLQGEAGRGKWDGSCWVGPRCAGPSCLPYGLQFLAGAHPPSRLACRAAASRARVPGGGQGAVRGAPGC
jgi:hypothetical protein